MELIKACIRLFIGNPMEIFTLFGKKISCKARLVHVTPLLPFFVRRGQGTPVRALTATDEDGRSNAGKSVLHGWWKADGCAAAFKK